MSALRNPKIWLVMTAFLSAMAGTTSGGKIIYLDADANGTKDGSSWENAYSFLQDALAGAISSSKPVEIRVAQGTYRPDEDTLHPAGTGARTAAFWLINGVTLKGGYAGASSPDPNDRNIDLYKTILSGDLNRDDGPAFANNTENSYHIFYHPEGLNLDTAAILDGFTITAGNADGADPHYYGGGMINDDYSSPSVNNCTFSGNSQPTTTVAGCATTAAQL